jgi:hypothetical protein
MTTLTVELTNISISPNEVCYQYDLFMSGKYVKFDTLTRATEPTADWLTNYFQKWAYRLHNIENALIVLRYMPTA